MLKVYNRLMKTIEMVLVALLSWSVIVTVAQIFWRYVLRAPLGWTEQAARAGFIWMVMLGIPIMFNRDIWMSFDIILEKMPEKLHLGVRGFLLVFGIIFSVFYFFASLKLCVLTGSRQVPGFPLPMNALYAAQPVGASLLFIVFVRKLLGLSANSKKPNGKQSNGTDLIAKKEQGA